MSTSFSADQYQNAFVPRRLQNWEVPTEHRENPKQPQGFTQVIANDCGHLLEGVPRTDKNPWGDFVGTWDLPKKIPGNCARVPTARAGHAADQLQRGSEHANLVLSGKAKNMSRTSKNEFPHMPQEAQARDDYAALETTRSPIPRMSPDPASPVGLPSDRRSPTPPERSPEPVRCEEQVIAL